MTGQAFSRASLDTGQTHMNVIALVPYPYNTVGGQRYRLEQWQPELLRVGIDMQFHHLLHHPDLVEGLWSRPPKWRSVTHLARATMGRVWRTWASARPDAVVVHREASLVGPPIIEALTALRAPVVFDFDDAIWLFPHTLPGSILTNLIRTPWKTSWIIRMAAAVSAGNRYLADYAARYSDNVDVIPSTIDPVSYAEEKKHSAGEPLVLGWTGSVGTAPYLSALLPTLAKIAQTMPLRLRVIGAEVSHPDLDIELIRWRPETEVTDLLAIDVGLMPLPDNPWTRGKCGMKALQYMALGIPAVVSPVGVNDGIVRDGVNGFLARDASEWHRAIEALRDPASRNRLGSNARQTVLNGYSVSDSAARFADLLRSVVRRG